MAKCKETAGVLFPHPCSRESTLSCSKCQRLICDLHARRDNTGDVCISCFKQTQGRTGIASDPFLLSAVYFSDYDTGGTSVPSLHSSLGTGEGDLDEAFEGDFDGT